MGGTAGAVKAGRVVAIGIYLTTAGYIVATAAYALIARAVLASAASGRVGFAKRAYVLWWIGLAVSTGSYAARNVLAVAGIVDLPTHLTLLQGLVVAHAAGLAGLVTYLLFLYTGGGRSFAGRVAGFYVVYALFFTYLIHYTQPIRVIVGPIRTSFEYAAAGAPGTLSLLVPAFYLPEFVAAGALGVLAFRLGDRSERVRLLILSTSLLAWSVANVGLVVASLAGATLLEFAFQTLCLVAPLGAYVAYRPPPWVVRSLALDVARGEAA